MDNKLLKRVEELNAAFLAADPDDACSVDRFFQMNLELYAWADEQGIDEREVFHVINTVGARNPAM